jgi:hypothetical protein
MNLLSDPFLSERNERTGRNTETGGGDVTPPYQPGKQYIF